MTPLPACLGGTGLVIWRLDDLRFAASWDSGEGAYRVGGRWNSRGVRAIYCSIDPATAIIEVAVHKGFASLDTVPHVLTALTITDSTNIRVVAASEVPNPGWLHPGLPSAGQQNFGDALLASHDFVVIPSAVSTRSWNCIFRRESTEANYTVRSQERFSLDTRLHRPPIAV